MWTKVSLKEATERVFVFICVYVRECVGAKVFGGEGVGTRFKILSHLGAHRTQTNHARQ